MLRKKIIVNTQTFLTSEVKFFLSVIEYQLKFQLKSENLNFTYMIINIIICLQHDITLHNYYVSHYMHKHTHFDRC